MNALRSISISLVLSLLFSSCGSTPSDSPIDTSQNMRSINDTQYQELVNSFRQWIDQRDQQLLSELSVTQQDLEKNLYLSGNAAKVIYSSIAADKKLNITYNSIESDFSISKEVIGKDYFYVHVGTYNNYNYDGLKNQMSSDGYFYKVSFEKNNSGKIDINKVIDASERQISRAFSKIESQVPDRQEFIDFHNQNYMNIPIEEQGTAANPYKRKVAANYALKWGKKRNPKYVDYDTNDCTNFSSQVLKAGGWIEKGKPDQNSTDSWFYEKPSIWGKKPSRSWRLVDDWKTFALKSKRVKLVNSINDLWHGDIVQAEWDWKSGVVDPDHNMVISGVNEKGERLIAAHSSDHRSTPFKKLKERALEQNPGKTQKYLFFKVISTE